MAAPAGFKPFGSSNPSSSNDNDKFNDFYSDVSFYRFM